MKTQLLNGCWLYRVGAGAERPITVPFSAHAVGHSECRRTFDLDLAGSKVFLQLDGITYAATVALNGVTLGDMLPYSEYRWDVTDIVTPTGNEILVVLEDIAPAFGPTEGWENFGGIIRSVKLLYEDMGHIEDVFFHTTLKNGFTDADYTIGVAVSAPENAQQRVRLCDGDTVLLDVTSPAGSSVTEELKNAHLWSPDDPYLYDLTVELLCDGIVRDVYTHKVGFRALTCDRHRFILNGKPTFLMGVCRHEMMGDSGHVVSPEMIEEDFKQIKSLGCNFVRLVHYPHCKETLDIADKVGLMVSEEPGLWWSDTSNPEVASASLEVLRRTVLRDRNHVSIAFWLCFNECIFTEQFLIDSARVCRECDPTRLVSGANCMENEDTLYYYEKCGFDFYTMHPYSETFARAREAARVLHDKPLLFSEWGGFHVYNNPRLLGDFIAEMKALYRQNDDNGALAGAFFWMWCEVKDYNRGEPACTDGTLREGLVTAEREPTMIYQAYIDAWAKGDPAPAETLYKIDYLDDAFTPAAPFVCESLGMDFTAALRRAEQPIRVNRFNNMRPRKLTVGPVLQDGTAHGLLNTPVVLSDDEPLVFTGDAFTDRITLIGCVSMTHGYPVSGALNEEVALLTVHTDDGILLEMPLRAGREVSTVFTTLGSSRIDPQTDIASPFARFSYETNFEQYVIRRLTVQLPKKANVRKIVLRSLVPGNDLLIYGAFGA